MAPLVVDPSGYLKPHHSVGHCHSVSRQLTLVPTVRWVGDRCVVSSEVGTTGTGSAARSASPRRSRGPAPQGLEASAT